MPRSSRCAEYYITFTHQIQRLTEHIPSWVWFLVIPALTQGFVKYIYFGGQEGNALPGQPKPPTARTAPVPAARKNA